MGEINFASFQQLDLRVVTIKQVDKIPQSKKLLKLTVDDGEGERQLIAGLADKYEAEELVGRQIVILANLAPKEFFGEESQGMLLAATGEKVALLQPDQSVPPGTKIS